MQTNTDITIFNARVQKSTRLKAYVPTTVKNVSLLISEAVNTNDGVWADQSAFKMRIPYVGAVVQNNRTYEPEEQYRSAEDTTKWTLQKGDYIALGLYDGGKTLLTKAELDAWATAKDLRLISVTEYSDNTVRGCDAVKHWRIGGE